MINGLGFLVVVANIRKLAKTTENVRGNFFGLAFNRTDTDRIRTAVSNV